MAAEPDPSSLANRFSRTPPSPVKLSRLQAKLNKAIHQRYDLLDLDHGASSRVIITSHLMRHCGGDEDSGMIMIIKFYINMIRA